MTSLSRPRVEFISTILQTVLNLGLLCLGLILVVFLGKETVHLADVLFAPEQTSKYELVEGLVVFSLFRIYRADCEVLSVRFSLPATLLCLYRDHRHCALDHCRS